LANIGNHENFLDVVKLIASFDRELASYLDDITRRAISKKARIVKQWPGEKLCVLGEIVTRF
jgi:hypothetical protein